MTFRNFVAVVIGFAGWALVTTALKSVSPVTSGVFYGVGMPTIGGVTCLALQLVHKPQDSAEEEWIYCCFAATLGGLFALQVIPHFFKVL